MKKTRPIHIDNNAPLPTTWSPVHDSISVTWRNFRVTWNQYNHQNTW